MSDNEIIQKARRESVRWRILKVLDAGRPLPVGEDLIMRILHEVSLPMTPSALRRELDYLRDRKLVVVEEGAVWSAELTREGVDIVEYTVPVEPGIARPPLHRD